ncbi:hypothetical protein AB0H28_20760 [Micromonospora sp. NPDC050980]|uniref:hypothetical protein n=1 Tax=Micromonospora sp. NPDC050980 TaxID=3155161 RepID=UPI003401C9CE
MPSHESPGQPAPDRPRPYPPHAAPHTPLRPMWCCRACGQQWPCPTSRLLLRSEYEDNPVSLSIYLCGLLYEATRDLYRLNPAGAPSPTDMFTRFVAWGPYRRPPAASPPDER